MARKKKEVKPAAGEVEYFDQPEKKPAPKPDTLVKTKVFKSNPDRKSNPDHSKFDKFKKGA